jgi:hypothetical protein
MLQHVFSYGLFYNAVIISDYMLLIMGLVNWEGSGSTCGLNKILSRYMPGKPETIHKKPHSNSQRPANTQRRHILDKSASCDILRTVLMNI